ncbi:hypothetical protein KUTeg_011104 [Tegillarca granosa]|uniref:Cyclopropane-fatty-acyl-phospholipid synthase n=1 Tax=Tegillarca granosa TaxID=220873 RepID=A0ABQ9F2V7_TEGGR|nr:hypothetical protein KUTeg_011104 [Tegillarca granosa]
MTNNRHWGQIVKHVMNFGYQGIPNYHIQNKNKKKLKNYFNKMLIFEIFIGDKKINYLNTTCVLDQKVQIGLWSFFLFVLHELSPIFHYVSTEFAAWIKCGERERDRQREREREIFSEDASLKAYCEQARVEDGQMVLDLGCGWGSFGLYICEKFPRCKVTCVSNSSTQRRHIENEAMVRGFSDRLDCITADANDFSTKTKHFYILIFSIWILSLYAYEELQYIDSESVILHMKNYSILMQRVSSWLKPSGLLFIQILCHCLYPYAFDTKPGSDTEWMAKNFFTGGTMPSSDLFLTILKKTGFDL